MDESTARSRHPDSLGQAFLWALLPMLALAPDCAVSRRPAGHEVVTTIITSTAILAPSFHFSTPIRLGWNYQHYRWDQTGRWSQPLSQLRRLQCRFRGYCELPQHPGDGSLPLTSNILGRVTGGNISNIYGTIQTTDFGNANLFLVNPSGIVLGPAGSVNVGGSVSFTTAQYLRLFDGVNSANFYANPANDGLANSVLAVAPVVDFGFLSPAAYGFLTAPDPSATITVQGSALSVLPGQSISLVGGKISIQGGHASRWNRPTVTPVGAKRQHSTRECRIARRVRCGHTQGRFRMWTGYPGYRLPLLGPSPCCRARASPSAARERSLSKAVNSCSQ